jgi:hypothetical protein
VLRRRRPVPRLHLFVICKLRKTRTINPQVQ